MRVQQESEYEAGLRADEEKARQEAMEERRKARQARRIADDRERAARRLGNPPDPDGGEATTRILVRLLDGQRISRRFLVSAGIARGATAATRASSDSFVHSLPAHFWRSRHEFFAQRRGRVHATVPGRVSFRSCRALRCAARHTARLRAQGRERGSLGAPPHFRAVQHAARCTQPLRDAGWEVSAKTMCGIQPSPLRTTSPHPPPSSRASRRQGRC